MYRTWVRAYLWGTLTCSAIVGAYLSLSSITIVVIPICTLEHCVICALWQVLRRQVLH